MDSFEGTRDNRAALDRWMTEDAEKLRLKWVEVARRAGMTAQHLVRIRKGRVPISWEAAAGIENALQWPPGSVEAAVDRGERPTGLTPSHSQLSAHQLQEPIPSGWTKDEELDYQKQYPAWNPLLHTHEMQFNRQAYRTMRDEFRRQRALEQITQRARSDEDSDHLP